MKQPAGAAAYSGQKVQLLKVLKHAAYGRRLGIPFNAGKKAQSCVPGTEEHRERRNSQGYGTSGYDSGRGNDGRSGYRTSSGYNDATRHTGNITGTQSCSAARLLLPLSSC